PRQRREKGSGAIVERGGRYYAVVSGRSPSGKQTRRWGKAFSSRGAAQKELSRLLAGDPGTRAPVGKVTLAEIVRRYILAARAEGRAPTTIAAYETILARIDAAHVPRDRVQVQPFAHRDTIGRERVGSLSRETIRAFITRMAESGLSKTTMHHTTNLLRAACRWGVREELIDVDPFARILSPARTKSQGSAVTATDIAALLAAIDGHRLEAPLLFSLATGMRRGEVCGLMRNLIDRAGQTIHVRFARAKNGRSWEQRPTKTKLIRDVPLSALAEAALVLAERQRRRWARAAGDAWSDSGFAFVDELGDPVAPNVLTDAFRRVFRSIEATTGRHARLHDLRHTAASTLIAAGVDISTVQSILGHASATTTLDIYSHVASAAKTRAMKALDDAFSPAKPGKRTRK
ncbi:MAG: tyrosine-type recombinase/integrase, partial [Polyangiaceae bacterium]